MPSAKEGLYHGINVRQLRRGLGLVKDECAGSLYLQIVASIHRSGRENQPLFLT